MNVNKLNKASEEEIDRVRNKAIALEKSGKPYKIMGKVTELPLCKEAIEHFDKHRHEYIWTAQPILGLLDDIDGLYYGIWLTDDFDHIPVILMSEEVMKSILNIQK
jgi:hypothetical protein